MTDKIHHAVEAALAYPLGELLKQMVRLRSELAERDDAFAQDDTGAGIAVLWDDPSRLPEFPEPILSGTTETLVKPEFEM